VQINPAAIPLHPKHCPVPDACRISCLGRITDHRINLTLYKLDEVLQGDLDQVIEPLINEHQIQQLAELGEES